MQSSRNSEGFAVWTAGGAGLTGEVYSPPGRGDEKWCNVSKEAVVDIPVDEDSVQRVFLGFQHSPDECTEAQVDKDASAECEQEQQAHRHDKIMEVEWQDKEVSLANAQQATHNAAMANCRLKSDYFSLMEHVKFVHECKKKSEREFLRTHISHVETIERLKREGAETESKLANLMEKLTQEKQDYTALWFSYVKTEEALAETKETSNMVIEFYNELKHVNSTLREEVNTLRESVKELEGKLYEDHKTHVKLFKSTLELENITLKEQVTILQDLVKKLERQLQEARCSREESLHNYLEVKNNSHCNSVPLCSTAKPLGLPCVKMNEMVNDNTQLQNENITLMNELESLQGSIKNPCPISHEDM